MKAKTAMMRRTGAASTRTSLALAVVVALSGSGALSASAATSGADAFATVAHPTALRNGDAVVGALPTAQPIHIEVALKMRDREGLDAFIADNARKQAARIAPQLMTSAQFLASHAPTQAQAQTVANYLGSMGYKNIVIAPNRLLVSADGTAATARNAFMTTFAQVRTRDGRIAFANTDAVRIPAALQDKILTVVGLQTVHEAHTVTQRIAPDAAHTYAIQGHYPTEFSSIYGGTGVSQAGGINVGMVAVNGLGPTLTDLDVFTTNHGLPAVSSVIVKTNSPSTNPNPNDARWDLQSQAILGAAGGVVGKLIFYDIPTSSAADLTADFNTIVASHQVQIVSVPFSECETDAANDGSASADDAIFASAVAQGQTFAVAAGDLGADECPPNPHVPWTPIPSWPAASQYVIAVGGTRLDATTTTWNSETAWDGTGGGSSTFEPMPPWQSAFGVPGSTRGLPDVAYDANTNTGALIVVTLGLAQIGGTDLSTAIFAGSWARVLRARVGIGFAGPVLYALPAADFHDITAGGNGGALAGPGYDFISGRGSMILSSAIADSAGLGNQPPVASFTVATPASGTDVHFLDTSTDSDGTIVSRLWNFGDGATSVGPHPIHTYATSGKYTVSETVKDNDGAAVTTTQTVYAGFVQLLSNPGFETGPCTLASWTATGQAFAASSNGQKNDPFIYDGVCSGAVESRGSSASISQNVAIPYYMHAARLSVHLYIAPYTPPNPVDKLYVQVNTSAGVPLATLAAFTIADSTGGYSRYIYDLSPYIGQTVQIQFKCDPNSNGQTYFFMDDVFVQAQ